jgi:hypothetical protein
MEAISRQAYGFRNFESFRRNQLIASSISDWTCGSTDLLRLRRICGRRPGFVCGFRRSVRAPGRTGRGGAAGAHGENAERNGRQHSGRNLH